MTAGPRAAERIQPGVGLALLLAAQAVVRFVAIARQDVNSDEPQHLHVAWGWAHGLLPYRDVCDNHSPLFSLLMAPFVALAGERADIVPLMRIVMVPIVLAALVATWRIAARLFSPRVAWWSVALIGVNADFVNASVEYRTDQLWMALWLWAIAVAVVRPLTTRRAAGAGLLAGLAASTSMKTSALMLGLAPGIAWAIWLMTRSSTRFDGPRLATRLGAATLGAIVAPLGFALAFAAAGSWPQLVFNVVRFNVVPGLGLWGRSPLRPLALALATPLILWIARELFRRATEPQLGARRAVAFTAGTLGWCVFQFVWPLVVHSDILPVAPLMVVFVVAALLELPVWLRARSAALARVTAWLVPAIVALETVLAPAAIGLARDGTRDHESFERELLQLTRPGEFVMDVKGEDVFRTRPCYLIIETIVRERVQRGLLTDTFAEDMRRSATPIACEYFPAAYPDRTTSFIHANYLRFAWLDVAGKRLAPAPGGARAPRAFSIELPLRYALVTPVSPARGMLDGTPCTGPRELARGGHVYTPAPGEEGVMVVWAPALERGLKPFGDTSERRSR
jgi:hypothetical protein